MISFKNAVKSSIQSWLLLLFVCLCLPNVLIGCSDDEAPAEITPDVGSEIYFTKSLDFTSDGGEHIISFTTNKDWTIDVSQSGGDVSWCTVFPSKGKAGDNEVLVKVSENTSFDDRNVVLNLTANDLTKKIVVTQKQKDAITLTTAKFEVDKNGGEIQVEVKANVSYEVIIPEQYQSWIHKRTIESDKCVFNIDKSEEYEKREGEIIFQSGDLEEILKVYQTGESILLLTKNEYRVSDKGEQIAVELNSNFDFDVKMPQVDWITTTITRSVSSHTLYYTVAPNETYDKRETEIIYYDRNDKSIADTLKIVQVQKDAILLSQKEYSVGTEGSIIQIEIKANVIYEVSIPEQYQNWIHKGTSTRGLSVSSLLFTIDKNEEYDKREGEIIFRSGELEEVFKVYQAGKTILKLKLETAGSLKKKMETLNIDYFKVKRFILEGDINGSDIRLIREMAGVDYIEKETNGILEYLDLTNVNIVEGGEIYCYPDSYKPGSVVEYEPCYTKNNVIGSCMFRKCKSLKEVLLPYSCVKMEDESFSYCKNLEKVELFDNVRAIGGFCFYACSLLQKINLPDSIEMIGKSAFSDCSTLESIVLPNKITRLYGGLFRDCSSLKEIVIPESVTYIEGYAFAYCSSLRSITISDSVIGFVETTFYYCIYNHRTTKTNQKYPSVNL